MSGTSGQGLRPPAGDIPQDPGVYRFSDGEGRVIYVGKAKNLRSRLTSYFQDPANLHPRTFAMVNSARSVDWVVVANEVEALTLEYSWIKEFDPRFNVRYRDDKSYPFLAVTMAEEYPRALVVRGDKRKGTRYFGPYAHAWAIRETVEQLLRVFPIRTCSPGVFRRASASGRPCLLGYIEKCSAPCVGRISADDHRAIVEDFCAFMAGNTGPYVRARERQMAQAAAELDFETAARLRDDLAALNRALERNALVLPDGTDADVIGLAHDELEACIRVFHVRDGRVRGERGFIVERVDDADAGTLVAQLCTRLYSTVSGLGVPRLILVPELPADSDVEVVVAWLSERRGGPVKLAVPRRGDKAALLNTVNRNAEQSLARHKARRNGDLTTRSVALTELADALDLPSAPLRIECFDVSNLGADDVVASMVVFEDGLPRPSEYRKFAIKGFAGQNDVAAIAEVVTRRFRRHQNGADVSAATTAWLEQDHEVNVQRGDPGPEAEDVQALDRDRGSQGIASQAVAAQAVASQEAAFQEYVGKDLAADQVLTGRRPRRFAYAPQLLVIDGGPPQVAAAAGALADLGVTDVTVCGLAKRLEEVWLPDEDDPVILPRNSQGLYLLQRVRDEAHRTALRYQRQKRSARMTRSALDEIPGLGPARKAALLKRFGSIKAIRRATVAEVAEVPGIGAKLAGQLLAALSATDQQAPPAVNLTTGEVLGDY